MACAAASPRRSLFGHRFGLACLLLAACQVGWSKPGAGEAEADSASPAAAQATAPTPMAPLSANPDEPALRQAVLSASWPQDMVRLADQYLQRFAQQPAAADVEDIRRQATATAQLLQRDDVQLFRSSFARATALGLPAVDLRRASLGDAGAALRLARLARQVDGRRESPVGWLQLAAGLGNDHAAYELALHYRRLAQPLIASRYERLALDLGYAALPSLDHARK